MIMVVEGLRSEQGERQAGGGDAAGSLLVWTKPMSIESLWFLSEALDG